MIKAFILLAILIGGQAMVQDSHADDNYPVKLTHSDMYHSAVYITEFKEYLRHDEDIARMPKAIYYRVDCYSDGSVFMHADKGYKILASIVTDEGHAILFNDMVGNAELVCRILGMEEGELIEEEPPTWYL